jgi:hypothetical protein
MADPDVRAEARTYLRSKSKGRSQYRDPSRFALRMTAKNREQQEQKQIPCGNDKQKSKGKGKGKGKRKRKSTGYGQVPAG